jgi:hypothetical protein
MERVTCLLSGTFKAFSWRFRILRPVDSIERGGFSKEEIVEWTVSRLLGQRDRDFPVALVGNPWIDELLHDLK